MEMEIIQIIIVNAVPFCIVIAYLSTWVYLLIDWVREDKENERK